MSESTRSGDHSPDWNFGTWTPVHTHDTRGNGYGVAWVQQTQTCTRTHAHHKQIITGLPIPVSCLIIMKLGRCRFDQAELIRSELSCNDCQNVRKQNKAISTFPRLPCYEQLKKFCSLYFQSLSISAIIITVWSSLSFSFQSDF